MSTVTDAASFRLGLVVNPYAGIGGPSAHKGSDKSELVALAQQGQLTLTAAERARTFLSALGQTTLAQNPAALTLLTVAGHMGETPARAAGFIPILVNYQPAHPSTAVDTQRAARALVEAGVDLLVFVGGDGTARDVCSVIEPNQPALGIPAGVKMHSGVYAINPQAGAWVVTELLRGGLVGLAPQEVRDIDEEAFRQGKVRSRYFGTLQVPEEGRFVQHVKQGGIEVEGLVLVDMADDLRERLPPGTLVVVGPGSTTHGILRQWGLDGTLLGVDLLLDGALCGLDVTEADVMQAMDRHAGPVAAVVTAIGGQGHIIGRGNQQLSPAVLRRVGREQLYVVASKTKLKTLAGRPLLIDSGDEALDRQWQGYIAVITGFQDVVMYPLGWQPPQAQAENP